MQGPGAGGCSEHQRVLAAVVTEGDGVGEFAGQEDASFFTARGTGEHEGGVGVVVEGDEVAVMREGDEEFNDGGETTFCGEVEAGVAFVLVVRIAQVGRVVAQYPLDKREVVEEDGAAETPRYVNHGDKGSSMVEQI